MDDYISRQTIIEAVHSAMYPYFCGAEDGDALSEDEKLVLSVNKTICTAIKALPSADVQPHQLTEEDLTELRHRFGNKVERVVRDMISGKEERWMT